MPFKVQVVSSYADAVIMSLSSGVTASNGDFPPVSALLHIKSKRKVSEEVNVVG